MLKKNIALWDVFKICERENSSDKNIKKAIPNDFITFYNLYPNIKNIFLTSKESYKLYYKYANVDKDKNYYILPYPSSTNATKTFEQKLNKWKIILNNYK